MTSPVRISQTGARLLRELRSRTGESTPIILERAIEAYRRQQFIDALNATAAAVHRDREGAREEQAEIEARDATLVDGLDDEQHPHRH